MVRLNLDKCAPVSTTSYVVFWVSYCLCCVYGCKLAYYAVYRFIKSEDAGPALQRRLPKILATQCALLSVWMFLCRLITTFDFIRCWSYVMSVDMYVGHYLEPFLTITLAYLTLYRLYYMCYYSIKESQRLLHEPKCVHAWILRIEPHVTKIVICLSILSVLGTYLFSALSYSKIPDNLSQPIQFAVTTVWGLLLMLLALILGCSTRSIMHERDIKKEIQAIFALISGVFFVGTLIVLCCKLVHPISDRQHNMIEAFLIPSALFAALNISMHYADKSEDLTAEVESESVELAPPEVYTVISENANENDGSNPNPDLTVTGQSSGPTTLVSSTVSSVFSSMDSGHESHGIGVGSDSMSSSSRAQQVMVSLDNQFRFNN